MEEDCSRKEKSGRRKNAKRLEEMDERSRAHLRRQGSRRRQNAARDGASQCRCPQRHHAVRCRAGGIARGSGKNVRRPPASGHSKCIHRDHGDSRAARNEVILLGLDAATRCRVGKIVWHCLSAWAKRANDFAHAEGYAQRALPTLRFSTSPRNDAFYFFPPAWASMATSSGKG